MATSSTAKPTLKKRRRYYWFGGIIVFLIAVRLVLPYILLYYANKSLAHLEGYYGHIDDIDLSLYRGAYQINHMFLNKLDSANNTQTDFFKANDIDLSVEWKPLFQGKLVGELTFETPQLIFTNNKTELGEVQKDSNDFRKILKDFMPLKVNRFEIRNGIIRYIDNVSTPKVNIALQDTYMLAQNLTNASKASEALPSTVFAKANAYEGTLTLNLKLNPLAEEPTFDLNAEIKNTNLVLMNDFMKAYGNFDVNKGTFGLYTEYASKDGTGTGYVKPIIKDLDVLGPEDKQDNFFQKIWEAIVGGAGQVLRNQKKDQVATKVPLEGNYKTPKVYTVEAIWQVLRNAFIQALLPSIDNQINLRSVDEKEEKDNRNLFQRIFSKDKNDKSK
ncbi:MAG: DUF748 domain-containing protein [Spirosomataceae bacterium]